MKEKYIVQIKKCYVTVNTGVSLAVLKNTKIKMVSSITILSNFQ